MTNNDPRKQIVLVIVLVLLAGGLYAISKHFPAPMGAPIDGPSDSAETATSSIDGAQTTGPAGTETPSAPLAYLVRGTIDLTEIGGTGLTVTTAQRISTTEKGVYAAMPLLKDKATILAVKDSSSGTRAYGVAFPETVTLTLDALSTAEATLIDPTADLATAREQFATIHALKCFPAYVAYLKQQLLTHTIEDLAKSATPDDHSNPQVACIDEIQALVRARTQ